jgi:hypothetical protein
MDLSSSLGKHKHGWKGYKNVLFVSRSLSPHLYFPALAASIAPLVIGKPLGGRWIENFVMRNATSDYFDYYDDETSSTSSSSSNEGNKEQASTTCFATISECKYSKLSTAVHAVAYRIP